MTTKVTSVYQRLMHEEEPEWMVWVLVIALLLLGLLVKGSVVGRTTLFDGGVVTLRYPAEWIMMPREEADEIFHVADPFASAHYPTSLHVCQHPVEDIGRNLQALNDIALAWSMRHGKDLLAYSALNLEPMDLQGTDAVVLDYAYVAPPAEAQSAASLPVVVEAQDVLFLNGETLVVVTLAADATTFESLSDTWQMILSAINAP